MRERAPREGRVAAAVLAALAVVAAGGVARAYEWFATKETQRPERWFREALTVRVSTVAPAEVPWETMEALYEEALGSWLDLPGCRLPQVDVVGTVDAADVTLPKTVDDEPDNLVVFIEDGDTWLAHEGATNSMIALTFVVANSVTG
ncbi:MAG: hypothetical protein KC635_23615, partial [Myxococcales bacterium]|nr:hypothetical protein [Myxococcales bacterium]